MISGNDDDEEGKERQEEKESKGRKRSLFTWIIYSKINYSFTHSFIYYMSVSNFLEWREREREWERMREREKRMKGREEWLIEYQMKHQQVTFTPFLLHFFHVSVSSLHFSSSSFLSVSFISPFLFSIAPSSFPILSFVFFILKTKR